MVNLDTMMKAFEATLEKIDSDGGVSYLEIREIAKTLKVDSSHAIAVIKKGLKQSGYVCRPARGVNSAYYGKGVYHEFDDGFWNFCYRHRKVESIPDVAVFRKTYTYFS